MVFPVVHRKETDLFSDSSVLAIFRSVQAPGNVYARCRTRILLRRQLASESGEVVNYCHFLFLNVSHIFSFFLFLFYETFSVRFPRFPMGPIWARLGVFGF